VGRARGPNLLLKAPGPGSARRAAPTSAAAARSRQGWFCDGAHLGSGLMLVEWCWRSQAPCGWPRGRSRPLSPFADGAMGEAGRKLLGEVGGKGTTQP